MNKFLTLFLLLLPLSAVAQIQVSGTVTDTEGNPVDFVRVMAQDPADSSVCGYAFTGAGGTYMLRIRCNIPNVILSVSSMEIEKQSFLLVNRTQRVDWTVKYAFHEIKSVGVRARKVWGRGDTISFNVAAFASESDFLLKDVLRKMPGINVSDNGLIRYKGQPISYFYIEDMDALQGSYGIATNNLATKDIATVQVYENHQPIRALKDVPTNDAAINVKLKEESKGIFTANATLGAGYDTQIRHLVELFGTYFGKKMQHILLAKSNDVGLDLNQELNSFTGGSLIGDLGMTSVLHPAPPSLKPERYYRNCSQSAAWKNIYKLGEFTEANANFMYTHDLEKRHGYSRATYLLPNGQNALVEEEVSTSPKVDDLQVELRYNKNKGSHYFNNLLELRGLWEDDKGFATGNTLPGGVGRIDQRKTLSHYQIENSIYNIYRPDEGRGIEISWFLAAASAPHRLRLSPGLYPELLNGSADYSQLTQHVEHQEYSTKARVSFLRAFMLKRMRIEPTLRLFGTHHYLNSALSGETPAGELSLGGAPFANDLRYTRFGASISPDIRLFIPLVNLEVTLPLYYSMTLLRDALSTDRDLTKGHFLFTPQFDLTFAPLEDTEVVVGGQFTEEIPGFHELYSGYLLSSYRQFDRGDNDLYSTFSLSTFGKMSYKNLFELFFVGAKVFYTYSEREALYNQQFDGPLSVLTLYRVPGHMHDISGTIDGSKGLDWAHFMLKWDVSGGTSYGQLLRQGERIAYRSQWLGTTEQLTFSPWDWWDVTYKVSWGMHRSRETGSEYSSFIHSMNESLQFVFNLPHSIGLTVLGEHYYNSAVDRNTHFFVADLGVNYTYKEMRFALDWTNILNTKTYTTANYSALTSSYREYELRPMLIRASVRFKLW